MLHFFDFDFCGDGGLNLEKKKKQSAVNSKLDADDSDDDDSEDDKDDEEENDDDDDDDEAELLRELEKIKRERAIEQEKKVLSSSSPFPSLPFPSLPFPSLRSKPLTHVLFPCSGKRRGWAGGADSNRAGADWKPASCGRFLAQEEVRDLVIIFVVPPLCHPFLNWLADLFLAWHNTLFNLNFFLFIFSFHLFSRWYDDVVFKNCAKKDEKDKKKFVNDIIRSDFHRKFMSKYVQWSRRKKKKKVKEKRESRKKERKEEEEEESERNKKGERWKEGKWRKW